MNPNLSHFRDRHLLEQKDYYHDSELPFSYWHENAERGIWVVLAFVCLSCACLLAYFLGWWPTY